MVEISENGSSGVVVKDVLQKFREDMVVSRARVADPTFLFLVDSFLELAVMIGDIDARVEAREEVSAEEGVEGDGEPSRSGASDSKDGPVPGCDSSGDGSGGDPEAPGLPEQAGGGGSP